MNKFLISLVMMLATFGTALGQKSYVNVVADHIYSSVYQEIYLTGDVPAGEIYLTGDVPAGIKTHYDGYGSNAMTVGGILNLLAKEGFAIEQMSCSAEGEVIILSKPSAPESDSIEHIAIDDQDVREVARFNLQGQPIDKNEKGIQIIVFSNFTTRTIIVE